MEILQSKCQRVTTFTDRYLSNNYKSSKPIKMSLLLHNRICSERVVPEFHP